VEAEAMPIAAGGEAVVENTIEICGGDADAVVGHAEKDAVLDRGDREHDVALFGGVGFDGVNGVGDEVHENLQDMVAVGGDGNSRQKPLFDLDAVAGEGSLADSERLAEQILGRHGFDHGGHLGEALLGGDDLFDVVDIFGEFAELVRDRGVFAGEGCTDLDDEIG
jgi:hypothetical protein